MKVMERWQRRYAREQAKLAQQRRYPMRMRCYGLTFEAYSAHDERILMAALVDGDLRASAAFIVPPVSQNCDVR